jgi:Eukaryotic aspartyl protease
LSSEFCTSGTCVAGAFDQTKSETFESIASPPFQIQYADGQNYLGTYFLDTFGVGDVTIKNMTMALAEQSQGHAGISKSTVVGIMGVSLDTDEAIYAQSNKTMQYPNVVHQMVNEGLIAQRAYSLWLNDLRKMLHFLESQYRLTKYRSNIRESSFWRS